MLNIGLDMKLSVKNTEYPLIFRSNTCVNCGAENTLVFVDAFGKESNSDSDFRAFDHIQCRRCKANYSIKWEKDPATGKMYPTPTDYTIKQEFFNLVNKKSAGEKVL